MLKCQALSYTLDWDLNAQAKTRFSFLCHTGIHTYKHMHENYVFKFDTNQQTMPSFSIHSCNWQGSILLAWISIHLKHLSTRPTNASRWCQLTDANDSINYLWNYNRSKKEWNYHDLKPKWTGLIVKYGMRTTQPEWYLHANVPCKHQVVTWDTATI